MIDNCSLKFCSVLSDLSGLSLRQEPPADVGRSSRFGAPGVLRNGEFFLTVLFKFAKEMMSEERVAHLHPFSDEKVCCCNNCVHTGTWYMVYIYT